MASLLLERGGKIGRICCCFSVNIIIIIILINASGCQIIVIFIIIIGLFTYLCMYLFARSIYSTHSTIIIAHSRQAFRSWAQCKEV